MSEVIPLTQISTPSIRTISTPEILALGEAMVEYNQLPMEEGQLYRQGFGGDTSNFVIAAARQGARVGYMSIIGNDRHGTMLRDLWVHEGVDTKGILSTPDAHTGIYFVTHNEQGHHFSFMRKGSAASGMTPELLNHSQIEHAKFLHVSGISLAISASARETVFMAMECARKNGVKVTFDTNLRLSLWPLDVAREVIYKAMQCCDICLPSLEDVHVLTGLSDPDALIDYCLDLGAEVVALKLGAQGALVADKNDRWRIPAMPCKPVDATGAGDAFGGAFVARILAGDDLQSAGRYAAMVAALSTQGYGAVQPIPYAEDVRRTFLT
jgi:2-dehydro-3-deoxygluconokinase